MTTRRIARTAALASVTAAALGIGAWALAQRRRRPAALAEQTLPQRIAAPVMSAGQQLLVIGLTLTAVALMILSAVQFLGASSNDEAMLEGGLVFLLGAAIFSLTPYLSPGGRGAQAAAVLRDAASVSAVKAHYKIRWRRVGLGVLLLTLVTMASSDANGTLSVTLGARGQSLLWVLGILAAAWGLSGTQRVTLPTIDRREAALLAVVLLAALVLRVYGLDQLRVLVDETHFSTGAVYYLHTAGPQLLRPIGDFDPFPRVVTYWVAEAVELFGHTLVALRIVPALVGTATVAGLYFLGRELFNRRVGLAAALLLATLPPFLHFSRLAYISVIDPLPGVLMLVFLARAMRTGSRPAYVLAGVMLGLTQYFHEAGRLTFPVLFALWLIGLLLLRTKFRAGPSTGFRVRVHWPFAWRGLLFCLVMALIVAAPLIITEKTQPEVIKTRLDYAILPREYWRAMLMTSDFRPQLAKIWEAALAFVRLKDATQYYGGTTPLILPIFVPLFLLGLAAVFRRRPPRGAWVLALWVVLTILGNSLLAVTTTSVHFIIALPAAALLMAVGLSDTLARLTRRNTAALLAVLVVAIGAGQTYYYFGPHLALYNVLMTASGSANVHDVLLRAADLPPRTAVHFVVDPVTTPVDPAYAQEVMRYFNEDILIDVIDQDKVDQRYLDGLSRRVPQAFFFKPAAAGTVLKIMRAFPSDTQPVDTPYPLTGDTYQLYLVMPAVSGS